MIDLDYAHKSFHDCNAIWLQIIQYMQQEDFYIDNQMFLIATALEKNDVCDKAKRALQVLDEHLGVHNKHLFQYVTDFFIIDMSDYVDFELPAQNIDIQ